MRPDDGDRAKVPSPKRHEHRQERSELAGHREDEVPAHELEQQDDAPPRDPHRRDQTRKDVTAEAVRRQGTRAKGPAVEGPPGPVR